MHASSFAFRAVTWCVITAPLLLLAACGGGGGNVPPVNVPPVAVAGAAQSVSTGTVVTVDGSASSDANGDLLGFSWSITSRPADSNAALIGANTARPNFTPDKPGSYTLSLVVNDGKADSAPATVLITAAIALQSIAVSPHPFATGLGITRRMLATGTYSDGSSANLNATVTWSSSQPSVASVTGGWVTGAGLGTTTITATLGATGGTAALDVTSGVWNPVVNSGGYGNIATLLASGKVLFTGTAGSGGELYDFVTETWSATGNVTNPRGSLFHTATLLPSGRVLVSGGRQFAIALASTEIYDPVANAWSAAASMTKARDGHTATLLPSGKVLVVGGREDPSTNASSLASAEIYDPVRNSWSPATSMATPRSDHTATLLRDGRVLVLGNSWKAGEIYDPVDDRWTPISDSPLGLVGGHAATLLNNGAVLITGANCTDVGTDASCTEIYDPTDNTWLLGARMRSSNQWHATTLMPSGKVLLTGGDFFLGALFPLHEASLFDPATNTWSAAASMIDGHRRHSATLLPNGAVLVRGGTRSNLQDAEVYW